MLFFAAPPPSLKPLPSLHLHLHLLSVNPPLAPKLTLPSLRLTRCSPSSPLPTTPSVKKRKRYRKQYPGEAGGIVEEMRFVAMNLRNHNLKKSHGKQEEEEEEEEGEGEVAWVPSMEGFLKYLVDSRVVFDAIERIVDESGDVACEQPHVF